MNKLFFFKDYLQKRYGQQLQRIAIDLPLGCPNREQRFGNGCIYCAEDGNRAKHLQYNLNLTDQVESGKRYLRERYDARPPYIAYFQSFTNTYAPVKMLQRYYDEVLGLADFKMMIISTRPDCLNDEVQTLLESYRSRYEVWIELGVQTANDETLKLIKRGHDFGAVEKVVRQLAERQIPVAAHLILGLPGETPVDFAQTAARVADLPFSGIKLHQLQVLKNTELAKLYAQQGEKWLVTLNEYEYADAAVAFLRQLPGDWVIMRLVADADANELIAPKWWMKKSQVIQLIIDKMQNTESGLTGVVTADGSKTLYHPAYRQHFHSIAGAVSEAELKFVKPSRLAERLKNGENIRLLDVGYGLGYNSFAAVRAAIEQATGKLSIVALENDLRVLKAAAALDGIDPMEREILQQLYEKKIWRHEYVDLSLIAGDARITATTASGGQFDLIFLDAFSAEVNPELWTFDFFRLLKSLMKPQGMLLTYSSAYPVRGALLKNQFFCSEITPFGRKRGGTCATRTEMLNVPQLSTKEMNIIMQSTAGVPYRDPGLKHEREWIIEHHRKTVKKLRGRGIPKWAATLPAELPHL